MEICGCRLCCLNYWREFLSIKVISIENQYPRKQRSVCFMYLFKFWRPWVCPPTRQNMVYRSTAQDLFELRLMSKRGYSEWKKFWDKYFTGTTKFPVLTSLQNTSEKHIYFHSIWWQEKSKKCLQTKCRAAKFGNKNLFADWRGKFGIKQTNGLHNAMDSNPNLN